MIIERKGSDHLKILTPAKLNLFLEVLGKRPDGYHDLETVMHTVDLYDVLEIRHPCGEGTFTTTGRDMGPGDDNLVSRAVRLFNRHLDAAFRFSIHLEKRIPVAAGLGGGSSDCAAALIGCNELTDRPLSWDELEALGGELGSDVPFFFHGGTAICRGRGEIVEPVRGIPPMHFLLLCPGIALVTRKVYENLNLCLTKPKSPTRLFNVIFNSEQVDEINACIFNRLERAALETAPELTAAREEAHGVGYSKLHLSGTGSTLFQLIGNPEVRGKESEFFNMDLTDRGWELFLVKSSPLLSR